MDPRRDDEFGDQQQHAAAAGAGIRAQAFSPVAGRGLLPDFRNPNIMAAPNNNWRSNSLGLGVGDLNVRASSRAPSLNMQQQQTSGLAPPSHYELAMMRVQQRDIEQLRLQQMSRRRSSMSDTSTISALDAMIGRQATAAAERLKKRRRIASSSSLEPPSTMTTMLSRKRGNMFPMPPLEGTEGRSIRVESMDSFQEKWEQHDAQSKNVFPNDDEKQKEYVKWRFRSSHGGFRIL